MGVDPNKVRVTGENSFLVLAEAEGAEPTAQTSHWRILYSPRGAGHVLFLRSALTGDEPRIYSDNIALARWLQEGIQASMRATYSGSEIPVVEAVFAKSGDARTWWTEHVETQDESIALTWYELRDPVVIANAPGENPNQPHGVYSVLIPADRAQLTIDGEAVAGRVFRRMMGDVEIRTSCLALSETWTIPRDHAWASED